MIRSALLAVLIACPSWAGMGGVRHGHRPPGPDEQYIRVVTEDAPVAWYRLGESSGPTLYARAGGLNATFPSATLITDSGAIQRGKNTAIRFLTNEFAFIADDAAWNLTSYTLEAWVKASVWPISRGRVWSHQDSTEEYWFFGTNNNGKIESGCETDGGIYVGGSAMTTGAWHHIAATRDVVAVSSSIYVDGAFVATDPGLSSAAMNVLCRASIGALDRGTCAGLTPREGIGAIIDEMAVYGAALGPQRILLHYRVGSGLR